MRRFILAIVLCGFLFPMAGCGSSDQPSVKAKGERPSDAGPPVTATPAKK